MPSRMAAIDSLSSTGPHWAATPPIAHPPIPTTEISSSVLPSLRYSMVNGRPFNRTSFSNPTEIGFNPVRRPATGMEQSYVILACACQHNKNQTQQDTRFISPPVKYTQFTSEKCVVAREFRRMV